MLDIFWLRFCFKNAEKFSDYDIKRKSLKIPKLLPANHAKA